MHTPIALSLYDTYLKREFHLQSSESSTAGILKMYSCGPTVYGYQHIGNMRAVWLPDTFASVAKIAGWDVRWTLNITDVGHLVGDGDQGEDKIESAAKKNQKTVEEIVDHYTDDYKKQCKSLNFCLPTGFYNPHATEYIEEQMLLSVQLVQNNLAYVAEDGIYFDYQKFVNHFGTGATGALSALLERDKKNEGKSRDFTDRVIVGSAKHPFDFAVWKFVDPKSLQQWKFTSYPNVMQLVTICDLAHIAELPGCPGWHSECVCMIIGTLATTKAERDLLSSDYYSRFKSSPSIIDIHFGGEDHIDIHHKNEILQSEALGIHLSKFWSHNKFVMIDGQKMSKSLGNVYQVIGHKNQTGFSSIKEEGFDPLAYRLMLFEHHYSEQLNFTWEKLKVSQNRLANLRKLGSAITSFARVNSVLADKHDPMKDGLMGNLTNNLNTPLFLEDYTKLLIRIVDDINTKQQLDIQDLARVLFWDTELLKLELFPAIPQEVLTVVNHREEAKKTKDFDKADAIRNELLQADWALDDYSWGTGVRRKC